MAPKRNRFAPVNGVAGARTLVLARSCEHACVVASAHWGTFTKQQGLQQVLETAQNAMAQYPCQVWDTSGDGDYIVIGTTIQPAETGVVVQVSCVPEGAQRAWVAVTALSENGGAAERGRNTIREWIVAA